jgi:4-amino-4-deoxychorismate lyase
VRAALVNGQVPPDAAAAIAIGDRGLNYGDGLFETIALRNGVIRRLAAHLERLAAGCERLKIPLPGTDCLRNEAAQVAGPVRDGIIKIIVTRGAAGRGYRPADDAIPTRVVTLHDAPPPGRAEIEVRWCAVRLSRNPALAGLKHLNRLEQVLAQSEWHDPAIDEGLMRDYEGELVCATSSNVFLVVGGELVTPDLRNCGVRGIMRAEVIRLAMRRGITVREEPLWPDMLASASEVFVTNAIRGIRAVVKLDELSWSCGPLTQTLSRDIESHA